MDETISTKFRTENTIYGEVPLASTLGVQFIHLLGNFA